MTAQVEPITDREQIVQNLIEQINDKKQKKEEKFNGSNAEENTEIHDGNQREVQTDTDSQEKRSGFKFSKGQKNWEVDDDAEFEFMADKKPVKMTLKEMRDAAAGGVAVRNRMRQLSEEKKTFREPFQEFSKTAKDDPLGALEKMFSAIQKIDPDANFNQFINDLASQAQKVARMEPNARKAYQLEKKLKEKDEKLSDSEQIIRIGELKQELMDEMGLPEEKIYEFGQHILNHPVLSQGVETEEDLMERIGDLAEEVELQKASLEALRKHNPDTSPRDPLIFELSNLLKANPDFDQHDLDEIAEEVLGNVQRSKASQKLSKRQRAFSGTRTNSAPPDFSRMKPVEALLYQIEQKKKNDQQNKLSNKRI
jgi:hypothetical protein